MSSQNKNTRGITKIVHNNKTFYRVFYKLLNKRISKRFSTIEEAIRFRDLTTTLQEGAEKTTEIDPAKLAIQIQLLMELKKVRNISDVMYCLNTYLCPGIEYHKPLFIALEEFLQYREDTGKRLLTSLRYKRVFKHVIDAIGKKTPLVLDLTSAVIESVYKKVSKETVMICVSTFCNWCVKRKYMVESPVANIYTPKPRDKGAYNATVLHPVALNVIIELLKDRKQFTAQDQVVITLLAFMGIRPYELNIPRDKHDKIPLRWSDINPEAKAITIRGDNSKTKRTTTCIGLPNRLWDILLQFTQEQFASDKFVGISVYRYKLLIEKLNAKLKTVEAEFIRLHGPLIGNQSFQITRDIFRHSFVSYGIEYFGIEHTAKITRHSFLIMQQHYVGIASKESAKQYFEGMDVSGYMTLLS